MYIYMSMRRTPRKRSNSNRVNSVSVSSNDNMENIPRFPKLTMMSLSRNSEGGFEETLFTTTSPLSKRIRDIRDSAALRVAIFQSSQNNNNNNPHSSSSTQEEKGGEEEGRGEEER